MNYEKFAEIINQSVFADSKFNLLKSIASSPENFVGLFRPTKSEVKIAQHLSQSHEIKFGYAFEKLIYLYLQENNCEMLPKSIMIEGERKELDLHFRKGGVTYCVEQKMRDNHDSTKKQGQIADFTKKLKAVLTDNNNSKVFGIVFFVDPAMSKNKKFYKKYLANFMSQHEVDATVVYGREFFDILSLEKDVWSEIIKFLTRWRNQLPSFPEFNFDKDAKINFEEIKNMKPIYFRKLFSNKDVCDSILPIIFPEGNILKMLEDYFSGMSMQKPVYAEISQLVEKQRKKIENNA